MEKRKKKKKRARTPRVPSYLKTMTEMIDEYEVSDEIHTIMSKDVCQPPASGYTSLASPNITRDDKEPHILVLVDYREKDLLGDLTRLQNTQVVQKDSGPAAETKKNRAIKIEIQSAPLLVGDIEITLYYRSGTEKENNDTLLPRQSAPISKNTRRWIWERKTLADLSASIKDGRWSEQKVRLASLYPLSSIHYIIEGATLDELLSGSLDVTKYSLSIASLCSAITNASVREGIHTHLFKGGTAVSALFLFRWLQRMATRPEEWVQSVEGANPHLQDPRDSSDGKVTYAHRTYPASIQAKKNHNITPHICFQQQLAQIPGISMKLAETIQKRFPDLRSLAREMAATQTKKQRSLLFSSLEGIGTKRADQLVKFLGYDD